MILHIVCCCFFLDVGCFPDDVLLIRDGGRGLWFAEEVLDVAIAGLCVVVGECSGKGSICLDAAH